MELEGHHFKWHKCSMEYSMEFHGQILPWNSMEFEVLCLFHGIPWNIPWNWNWCRQMKYHRVPWNSMELWDCHFNQYHVTFDLHGYSMEFYGTLESPVPWNKKSPSSMGFHGIRNSGGGGGGRISNDTNVPWNSMEFPWNSMEFCRQMRYNLVPWNSMELWDCHFIQCYVTQEFHVIFHGIPWNSGVAK